MACYSPLKGWRARRLTENGKRGVVFNVRDGYVDLPVDVPCGQCIGCRLERSRQWAMRCMHEASLHAENAFITLTYDNQHLPHDGSLNKAHFQKFMKRLRFSTGARIRYFHCGEYGDDNARPHYHACLFGIDFPDKVLYSVKGETRLYYSAFLERTWGLGFATVGDVTFDSAAYVARYCIKKVNGKQAEEHYLSVDNYTGELHRIEPEYVTMSRGGNAAINLGGIGKGWFDKYSQETYTHDSVIVNEREVRPPKFYDKLFEVENPERLQQLKRQRVAKALAHAQELTPERLRVREQVQRLRMRKLSRSV